MYEHNPVSKNYNCEYIFCEEKQNVGLCAYHLENLRVPLVVRVQFGNHWPWLIFITFPLIKLFKKGQKCRIRFS